MTLKTDYRIKKEAKEMAIYNEFQKLAANPENAIKKINQYLMKKYDINAEGTIWNIRKRVEKRLNIQAS
jgi:hypothetical protein